MYAYPQNELNQDGSLYQQHTGMDLRDWFAGQLLPGTLNEETDTALHAVAEVRGIPADVARAQYCYEMADLMMIARDTGR